MHWQGAGLLWPLQQAYSTVDGVLDRRRCFQGVSLSNLEVFVMSMAREAAAAASFAAGLHNVCALTTCLLHTSRGSGLHDLTEHVLVTHNSPIDTSAHASRSVLNLSGLAWPASSTLTPACTSPLFRKHSAQWTCSDWAQSTTTKPHAPLFVSCSWRWRTSCSLSTRRHVTAPPPACAHAARSCVRWPPQWSLQMGLHASRCHSCILLLRSDSMQGSQVRCGGSHGLVPSSGLHREYCVVYRKERGRGRWPNRSLDAHANRRRRLHATAASEPVTVQNTAGVHCNRTSSCAHTGASTTTASLLTPLRIKSCT